MTTFTSTDPRASQGGASRNLRITILGLNYAPEPTGNAPYTASLAEGLAALGHRVHVVTGYPHYPEWQIRSGFRGSSIREERNGVRVTRLRHFVPANPGSIGRLHMELSFGLRLLFARWTKPDVVLLVSPALFSSAFAVMRARFGFRRPPIALWVQDLYSRGLEEAQDSGKTVVGMATRFESWVLRSAHRVVAIHDRFRKHMVGPLAVEDDRVTVIKNWTHLPPHRAVDRDAVRVKLGWGPGETVILHAGNMGAKQGLENVIEAARISSLRGDGLRFTLMGDGNQRSRLEALGRDIPHLRFIDPLPDEEFQSALGAADILLVNEKPEVSEMAVPSKLTSYFSTGLPVLAATQLGSVTASEIEASGGGIRVDAGNPEALVQAANKLSADKAAAELLGRNGLRYRHDTLSKAGALAQYDGLIRDLAASLKR